MKNLELRRLLGAIVLLITVLFAQNIFSQTIQIRNVNCQDEGCRGAQVISATDNSAVSVLYSGFRVALSERNGRRARDRINSNLSFSVIVPQGFSLEFINIDLRGFASISTGAQGKLIMNQFSRRRRGALPNLGPIKVFDKESSGEFLESVALGNPFKSECGDQVDFRVMTALSINEKVPPGRGQPRTIRIDPSEISLDSADLSTPTMVYKMKLKPCR